MVSNTKSNIPTTTLNNAAQMGQKPDSHLQQYNNDRSQTKQISQDFIKLDDSTEECDDSIKERPVKQL